MIRPFDAGRDVADIARIYRWYVENSTATFEVKALSEEEMGERAGGIDGKYPFFVWEEEERVKGYCYAHPWKGYPAYSITLETTIYLDPSEHGKGMGTLLMERLIEECRKLGFVSLIACITAENEESCRFHEKLGFSQVSDFKKVGRKFGRLLDVTDYQYLLQCF